MSLVASKAFRNLDHFGKLRENLHNILEWGLGERFHGKVQSWYALIVDYESRRQPRIRMKTRQQRGRMVRIRAGGMGEVAVVLSKGREEMINLQDMEFWRLLERYPMLRGGTFSKEWISRGLGIFGERLTSYRSKFHPSIGEQLRWELARDYR